MCIHPSQATTMRDADDVNESGSSFGLVVLVWFGLVWFGLGWAVGWLVGCQSGDERPMAHSVVDADSG